MVVSVSHYLVVSFVDPHNEDQLSNEEIGTKIDVDVVTHCPQRSVGGREGKETGGEGEEETGEGEGEGEGEEEGGGEGEEEGGGGEGEEEREGRKRGKENGWKRPYFTGSLIGQDHS